MRKIVFVFFILFIVFPVFASEIIERQTEKQIVIAFGGSACRNLCRDDLNQCKRSCNLLRSNGPGNEITVNSCIENCMDYYDRCLQKCD